MDEHLPSSTRDAFMDLQGHALAQAKRLHINAPYSCLCGVQNTTNALFEGHYVLCTVVDDGTIHWYDLDSNEQSLQPPADVNRVQSNFLKGRALRLIELLFIHRGKEHLGDLPRNLSSAFKAATRR